MSKHPVRFHIGSSRVAFVVRNDLVGTVLQVLQDHRIQGFTVAPAEPGEAMPPMAAASAPVRERVSPTRGRVENTRLGSLVMSILSASSEPMTSTQVGEEIAKHSFNRNSASPCLSDLLQEGSVHREAGPGGRNVYSVKKTLVLE